MIKNLDYVGPLYLSDYFLNISELNSNEILKIEFLDYFIMQYLGEDKIPLWNLFREKIRRTKGNHHLNSLVDGKPTSMKLLSLLANEGTMNMIHYKKYKLRITDNKVNV